MTVVSADTDRTPPEDRMSELVLRHLGIQIEPARLRHFIRTHWLKVNLLAHAIHGEPATDAELYPMPPRENAP